MDRIDVDDDIEMRFFFPEEIKGGWGLRVYVCVIRVCECMT